MRRPTTRRPHALLRRAMTVPVAALLVAAGLAAPAAVLSTPAAADEAGEEASTAVTAPTSFGQSADPIPDDQPQPAAGGDYSPDQDVVDYWTPERMAQAVPYEQEDEVVGEPEEAAAPGSRSSGSSSSSTDPEGMTEPVLPEDADAQSRVNGKLFFNGYGVDNGYCSASAVNTPTKRVVITAGHCVYRPRTGQWMRNVVFVPDYDLNNEDPDPVGIWTARSLRTFDSWIDDSDYTHDVGLVTLNNGGDDNQPLVEAVGGHGLAWGGSYEFQATLAGYPGNILVPKGVYTMHTCEGAVFASQVETWQLVSVDGCNFGSGASGGPWIYANDQDRGVGYVRSVTSLWLSSTGQDWGPYFTEDVMTMVDMTTRD